MTSTQTVTRLEIKNVYNDIVIFLNNIDLMNDEKKSNTRQAYLKAYVDFFAYMRNKRLEELKPEDLHFIQSEIMEYRNHLKTQYANASINQKIAALRSLYNHFKINGYNVEPLVFKLKALPENIKTQKRRGWLTWEEVDQMIVLLKNGRKGRRKWVCKQLALLFELAAKTSIRMEALLNLEWDDFYEQDDIIVIKKIDKQKEHIKPIRKNFYERLLELKTINKDKVFSVTEKTINKTLKELVEEIGIDPNRNISFHSFKKCGAEEAYILSGGDIKAVAEQTNDSDAVALKYYLQRKRDPSTMLCLQIGEEIDLTPLRECSKEKLLELIEKCDRGVWVKLLMKLDS